jgi:sugar lactone lactonase YvrE
MKCWIGLIVSLLLGLGIAIRANAQTPNIVLAVKLTDYQQSSANDRQTVGAELGVQVGFATTAPVGTNVQLKGPGGNTATLQRQSDGSYALQLSFADVAGLDAAFPDGNYTIVVSGGTSPSSTLVAINTGIAVNPVLITNFDALQAWPDPQPTIHWQPIGGATNSDFVSVSVSQGDGTEVFSSPDSLLAGLTQTSTTPLPLFKPLVGELAYAHLAYSTAGNATTVAAGRGFDLKFSLQCVIALPVISFQPVSQVVSVGATVIMDVTVSGVGPFTFQWKKNGVPIVSPTPQISDEYTLLIGQVADGGAYTIDVTNAAGTVTSAPAQIAVRPTFSSSIYLGAYGTAGASIDGSRLTAQFSQPKGMAADANGNLYVIDWHSIRKIDQSGNVSTLAGVAGVSGSVDGLGTAARFNTPSGLAVDQAGNIYVADELNRTIRKITPAGAVTTLAGAATQSGYVDDAGSAARFSVPYGVAVDSAANLFVTDLGNHAIRKITAAGVVSTFAGSANAGSADGLGSQARFGYPEGIAIDRAGNLFVVDGQNIRKITPSAYVTTLYSGNLPLMSDVAVDPAGNLYVAGENTIARITPDGAVLGIKNLYVGMAGTDPQSGLFEGVAIDASGAIYAADAVNRVVVRAEFVPGSADPGIGLASQPQSQVIATGSSLMLAVTATGPNVGYQWRKDGSVIPGATTNRLYLSNTTAADAGSYSVLLSNGIGVSISTPAMVSLNATPDVGRLSSLSVRSQAGTGDQTLIVGLSLGGSGASGTRPVLLRGIGPSLVPFGVLGALADPTLAVLSGSQVIATNDNWGGSSALANAFAAVGAFPLPSNSLDAATTCVLSAGAYTVQLGGKAGTTGVGLAEIYDLSSGSTDRTTPRMLALSCRAPAGAGDNVLIAGFVIGGSTSKTLLIRGVGPSLTSFGLTGVLPDPQLRIYAGQTVLASNTSWNYDFVTENAFPVVGAFGLTSPNDAALLITLPPGIYSALVSSAGGNTGLALVEIYEMP